MKIGSCVRSWCFSPELTVGLLQRVKKAFFQLSGARISTYRSDSKLLYDPLYGKSVAHNCLSLCIKHGLSWSILGYLVSQVVLFRLYLSTLESLGRGQEMRSLVGHTRSPCAYGSTTCMGVSDNQEP